MVTQGIITGLHIYPVKSLQGISLSRAELTPNGFKWDRFWMIVNEDGLFMSQRNLPHMATITTALNDEHLTLSHPNGGAIHIPLDYQHARTQHQAKVWQSECQVLDEGEQVSTWLTQVLGRFRDQTLRLVRLDPTTARAVSTNHTQGQIHHTYFADGYPYLVTSTESLTELNKALLAQSENAVPMSRFRTNIVVSGVEPFIEHHMPYLHFTSEASLLLCKPCERCKMTSIDQSSGLSDAPKQPLQTLMKMDHVKQKGAFFGHNAVLQLDQAGSISKTHYIEVGQTAVFSPQPFKD